MSNRASSLIPIPASTDKADLIATINERLLRIDQELGRLNTLAVAAAPSTTVTAGQNTKLTGRCTGPLVNGAGYANVPGCTVTLDRAGVWLVRAVINGIINVGAALLAGHVLVTPLVGAPAVLVGNIVLQGPAGLYACVGNEWPHTGAIGDVLALQSVGVGTGVDPVTAGLVFSSVLVAEWVGP